MKAVENARCRFDRRNFPDNDICADVFLSRLRLVKSIGCCQFVANPFASNSAWLNPRQFRRDWWSGTGIIVHEWFDRTGLFAVEIKSSIKVCVKSLTKEYLNRVIALAIIPP